MEAGAEVHAVAEAAAAAAAAALFACSCAMCASNNCISTLALRVDLLAYRLKLGGATSPPLPPGVSVGESVMSSELLLEA